jgi:cytochrome c biogenesis protein CcmG/thiol:disulfide interchange protein DsbE
MAMKKCPVCGVSVKAENLERHVRNQHPKEQVDLSETLTAEEQKEIKDKRSSNRPGLTSGGRRLITIVAIIVAVLLIALVAYEYLAPPPIQPGNAAPLFTLTSTASTTISLASYKGGGVLIEFMDVDCPYCQQEAPTLASLFSTYASKGVHFVSIDINFEGQQDTVARIDAFSSTYGTSWPYCLDPGATVQHAYGVTSTPTIFIVDKTGVIYQQMTGIAEASQANLVTALNAVSGA